MKIFRHKKKIFLAPALLLVVTVGVDSAAIYPDYAGFRTFREKLARVKVFVDIVTGKTPKFLGEKVLIPAS